MFILLHKYADGAVREAENVVALGKRRADPRMKQVVEYYGYDSQHPLQSLPHEHGPGAWVKIYCGGNRAFWRLDSLPRYQHPLSVCVSPER